MTQVVVNRCYGGFGLSKVAVKWLADHGVQEAIDYLKPPDFAEFREWYDSRGIDEEHIRNSFDLQKRFWEENDGVSILDDDRSNPLLIQCVEELGGEVASGQFAKLDIVEVPDDVSWHIEEYDGNEHVAEDHRTW